VETFFLKICFGELIFFFLLLDFQSNQRKWLCMFFFSLFSSYSTIHIIRCTCRSTILLFY